MVPTIQACLTLPYDCCSDTCTTRMPKCLQSKMEQDLTFATFKEDLEKGYCLICIGSLLPDMALEVWGVSDERERPLLTSAHRS